MQDLAHTIRKRLTGQTGFTAPKRPLHSFGIDHYAGQVQLLAFLIYSPAYAHADVIIFHQRAERLCRTPLASTITLARCTLWLGSGFRV